MANKRLSELQELTSADLQPGDLFYVVDTSTNILEGKRIRADSIQTFLLSGALISASFASSSVTASYIDPNNVGNVESASYSLSGSWADRTFFSTQSDTSSYIRAYKVDGVVFQSTSSYTASYLFYNGSRPNGTASYSLLSLTSSYVKSSSYLIYTGVPNGTAFSAITASYSYNASSSVSSSYLIYDSNRPNGTASYAQYASSSLTSSYVFSSSYALTSSYSKTSQTAVVSNFSNFLSWYGATVSNGTASYSWSGSHVLISDSASYLIYDGITPNGTASYSVYSSASLSSSYAFSSSRSENTFQSVSSSYALTASYPGLDLNQYKIYGPFNTSDATYGTQTSTNCSYRNFIIKPPGNDTTVIVQALGDVKVPITTTDTDLYTVNLILEDWTNGALVGSTTLDISRPNNYVNFSITGAFTLNGYSRTPITLMGSNQSPFNVSGSWYTLRVTTTNGATFDSNALSRGPFFYIYVSPDTDLTRTAYPPF